MIGIVILEILAYVGLVVGVVGFIADEYKKVNKNTDKNVDKK